MTISSAAVVDANAPAQTSNIGISDFLKILTTQLNNQDPLKPVDNQEFVAQIAQFATLAQSQELNTKINSLLSLQSTTYSVGLLGKTVDVDSPVTFSGRVSAVSMVSGSPTLTLISTDGIVSSKVDMSRVSNVR